MPVIRGPVKGPTLTPEERITLIKQLENELAGNGVSSGKVVWEVPLVFENPLERLDGPSDHMDVLVVWNAFDNIRSEERTSLIMEAYHDHAEKIVQALGVTREEAMDQCLLPYRILPRVEPPVDVETSEAGQAMVKEGGIQVGSKVKLYLPTRKMADAAFARLDERFPRAKWAILER